MIKYSGDGLLTVLAKTRYVVSIITFIITITLRFMHFNYFVVGSCITAILAKLLKRSIKQPRPYGQKGYGMPSTHSQVIMYFATYAVLVGYQLMPFWLITFICLFAMAVVWSRVQLKHHTLSQVLVGTMIGIFMALLWFYGWSIVSPYLDYLYYHFFSSSYLVNTFISFKTK
ncbi:unnamed protein product [Cunninghamella blakesleeana]